jgi:HlyD family secretion protein
MRYGRERIRVAWAAPALLAALAGLALCGTGCKKDTEAAAPLPVVTVQVGGVVDRTIERKVNADAIVYPMDQAALVPKISAPVKKFYVNRGSAVHAGQLLAELESQDLAGAVTDNQGGLQQAQASYDAAVQKAQQDLEVAKQTYDIQQKLYQDRMELLEQGAVARKDVDDAALALTQAKTALDTAQKAYDVKVSEGELTSAKGKSAAAGAGLSYARITSPIDGIVTDRPFYAG